MPQHESEKPAGKQGAVPEKAARERAVIPASPEQADLGAAMPGGASRLHDPRFSTAQRQGMASQIGRLAGNRTLQRTLAQQAESRGAVVQRGVLEAIGEWWNGLWSTDPEDVVRNLDSGLEHANTALEAAASVTTDTRRRAQLEQLSGRLEGLHGTTGRIVQVLDTAENISKVEDFVEALNDIPDDIASDPEGAADAFGRLFAAAGDLGQLLPEGPWTMYFTFLSGMRNFFTNVSHGTNPDLRWRRDFEEIDREAGNATSRGVD